MPLKVDVLPQQAGLLRSVMMDYESELASISIPRSILSCIDEDKHDAFAFHDAGWMTGSWWGEVNPIEKKKQQQTTPLTKQMVSIDLANRNQVFVSHDLRPRVSPSIAEHEERMFSSLLLHKGAERMKGKPTRQAIYDAVRRACREMLEDGIQVNAILADVSVGAQFSGQSIASQMFQGHRVIRLPDDWHIKFTAGKAEFDEHIPARWTDSLRDVPRVGVSNIFVFGRGTKGMVFHSPVREMIPDQVFSETLCMVLYDNALVRRITCDWNSDAR